MQLKFKNDYEKVCNSCTIYIVLFVIFFIISISISSAFIYFQIDNTYVYVGAYTNIKTETFIY